MNDLARLLVVLVVDRGAQPPGEKPQRLLAHRRIEGEHLKRGDDAVAAEQGCVPGNPRGVVAMPVELRGQQAKVEERATEDAIDQLVVDVHARTIGEPSVGLRTRTGHRGLGLRGSSIGAALARWPVQAAFGQREADAQLLLLPGIEPDRDAEVAVLVADRPGGLDRRRTLPPVEPDRGEAKGVTVDLPAHLAPGRGQQPANLQHRQEVGVEAQLELELEPFTGVGVDGDAIGHPVGEHPPLDPHPQRLQRQLTAAGKLEVRIG